MIIYIIIFIYIYIYIYVYNVIVLFVAELTNNSLKVTNDEYM